MIPFRQHLNVVSSIKTRAFAIWAFSFVASHCAITTAGEPDTFAPLRQGVAPQNFEQMWASFDPQAEPLETEVLNEWTEDGVTLRIVRFRIGIFKGRKSTLAAVYGFPTNAADGKRNLPGLLQIHGGGQYADHKACVANAKRGYATISIAWAGRISAPKYRVSPSEVQLFWDQKTDDPAYRETTDWAAVDGYHAPSRNKGNQFPSAKAAAWTLDSVESPRNSGWFLCAVAARRALTFLQRQPEVDGGRLGVYGHSMGGKLTVLTSVDPRVKAAAPSCGGISDRYNDSPLFNSTLGDHVSLKKVACPIFFLSPANDFHGRIGDLPKAVSEIQSTDWRVTCSPHHNHQDTDPYEVATMLWMDQHLKKTFRVPHTPTTILQLNTASGLPEFTVQPDSSEPVLAVDVFYTQQGKPNEEPSERDNVVHRFWHHAGATKQDGTWLAQLPLSSTDKPIWVYANVRYKLDEPVAGVGYYYGSYEADSYNVSSLMQVVSAEEVAASTATTHLKPSLLIESFEGDWQKEWFTYRPEEWAHSTNKLNSEIWKAPAGASLSIDVRAAKANKLVVVLDKFVAEVEIPGGNEWRQIALRPQDFHDFSGNSLTTWDGIRLLKLTHSERLRPGRGEEGSSRVVGANWKGEAPEFRSLQWHVDGK